MLIKFIKYIFLSLSLSAIASTTVLQYSHDQHIQHCENACADNQNPHADECALCWFVAHQVSTELTFSLLLQAPNTHTIITAFKRMPKACTIDLAILQKGNKDPPPLI